MQYFVPNKKVELVCKTGLEGWGAARQIKSNICKKPGFVL